MLRPDLSGLIEEDTCRMLDGSVFDGIVRRRVGAAWKFGQGLTKCEQETPRGMMRRGPASRVERKEDWIGVASLRGPEYTWSI